MLKLVHVLSAATLCAASLGALAQGAPVTTPAPGAPLILKVYSAGSLRGAWADLARAYQAKKGVHIDLVFGSSGLLRERLEKGEKADLFTSADTGHPKKLAEEGRAEPMQVFTGNQLCALTQPEVGLTAANLLDKLLDPKVRVATSTPKADPLGDYTWVMFERAGKLKPGASQALSQKALQLVGGPTSPPAPKDRNVYGKLMEDRAADVFITYCTNALAAQHEVPKLVSVTVPENLSVTATYGMAVLKGASPQVHELTAFLLSDEGQNILKKQGFAPLTK